jgi:hypothetical protein
MANVGNLDGLPIIRLDQSDRLLPAVPDVHPDEIERPGLAGSRPTGFGR